MPKGDELKFPGASNTEGEQGNEGRKNRDHAHDGMAPTQKSLFFLPIRILSRHSGVSPSPFENSFRIIFSSVNSRRVESGAAVRFVGRAAMWDFCNAL